MAERTYTDKFTLDGRLRPQLGVTKTKVKAAKNLLEAALRGDIIADATLREAVTSTDAMFNVGHLVNLTTIPQLDKLERSVVPIVGSGARTTPDFRPIVLQSLFGDLGGPGIDANGGAVTVPEGTAYPKVSITGVESFYTSLEKHGFSFDFTWEAKVNDTVGFFQDLPTELLSVTDDTEYAQVWDALLQATVQLPAVTLPDGTDVPTNAAVSPDAIFAAIIALGERTINGRQIGTLSGYNVFVPVARKAYVDYQLRQYANIISITEGNVVFGSPDNSVLSTVEVIESPRLTGTQWRLVPKPGSTRRPVLELLRLRGYETPELRVSNATGDYAAGGKVSPFEGSFETDSISYRYRYVTGGVLWDEKWIVVSEGDNN
jgi:hypothetical protein